ncbi:MAG TPA: sporulation integral membrane protein YtvI [Candidatus Bariatricus faecipullorum]|nr:sporulation integral membrane protein YtvI [Candidatus Bariatricus faecipullorum]
MEKRKKFIINFLYFAIITAAVFLVLQFALTLLFPFVAALFIAYILRRPIRFLSRKTTLPRKASAVVMVLIFYGTIGTLLVLGSIRAFSFVSDLVQSLPRIYLQYVNPVMRELFQELEHALGETDPAVLDTVDYLWGQLTQSLSSLVSDLSLTSMEAISSLASSLPALFIRLLLMVISTFFIAMDYDAMASFCMRQLDGWVRELVLTVKEYVVGTLFVCIRSYALIMSITFCELAVGLAIIGIENSVLISLGIAIFDILPVLGTGGVMIPWAIISAVLGDIPMALKLLALYLVITVVRNIIEPKIVGKQIGLHPVITLVSMFAGVQLFGVAGLFGFPIGLSLILYLNRTGVIHIFKTKEEAGEEYPEAGEDTEAENDAEAEKDAETKAHTEETKDVSEKQQNTDGKTI